MKLYSKQNKQTKTLFMLSRLNLFLDNNFKLWNFLVGFSRIWGISLYITFFSRGYIFVINVIKNVFNLKRIKRQLKLAHAQVFFINLISVLRHHFK